MGIHSALNTYLTAATKAKWVCVHFTKQTFTVTEEEQQRTSEEEIQLESNLITKPTWVTTLRTPHSNPHILITAAVAVVPCQQHEHHRRMTIYKEHLGYEVFWYFNGLGGDYAGALLTIGPELQLNMFYVCYSLLF